MDHRFSRNGPPLLFETMLLGGMHDGTMWRYSTWAEAESWHHIVVEAINRGRLEALLEEVTTIL